jgi:hypothetical protein
MIYANGDIYEGSWQNDLKHGYGILEKKNDDKYYGYWNNGLKEGQGYFYYCSTGKIYLGEWHEDAPRCGIFTDVDDENIKKEYNKHFKAEDSPSLIPIIKLNNPEGILEDSINKVHFLRNIKLVKNKNFSELFANEFQNDLMKIFTNKQYTLEEDKQEEVDKSKIPENLITVKEFKAICLERLGQEISDETLELIFYVFNIPLDEESKIDFLFFSRLFYLINAKKITENESIQEEENISGFSDEKLKDFEILKLNDNDSVKKILSESQPQEEAYADENEVLDEEYHYEYREEELVQDDG